MAACQKDQLSVLVMSPDTDIYHIGLPLQCVTQKQIIVQVSAVNSHQLRLLNLTSLVQALLNDPDLANIDPNLRPQILQTLFVVSGCAHFSADLGKQPFLGISISMHHLSHLETKQLLEH